MEPLDNRAWKGKVKKVLWPCLFRIADQVLALSPAGVDLMRALSIPQDRISLTPFVVDNDWWAAQSALVDRQVTRESWGVSERDLAVLFCAKLQSWKRPADLLRAFASANVPNSVLIFAGEGPLRPKLEAETATLGIQDRVRFLGFFNQSQLPAIYTSADIPCAAVRLRCVPRRGMRGHDLWPPRGAQRSRAGSLRSGCSGRHW